MEDKPHELKGVETGSLKTENTSQSQGKLRVTCGDLNCKYFSLGGAENWDW
jgi:hypothetical protein